MSELRLTDKQRAAMDKMVTRFQSGDLSPIVQIVKTRLPEDAPARHWTLTNRVMVFAQSGSLDCRGFRQWQEVGRQVNQGGAAFLCIPKMIKDKDDPDECRCCGFLFQAVHPYQHTKPIDEAAYVFSYEPQEMPPLHDVAERLGVKVDWSALPSGLYGWCGGGQINLGTYDPSVWFHELAHAAHRTFEAKDTEGQDSRAEAIAEFTAAVLMELYSLGDRSGNAWEYIKGYDTNPIRAIQAALKDIERVLAIILDEQPVQ